MAATVPQWLHVLRKHTNPSPLDIADETHQVLKARGFVRTESLNVCHSCDKHIYLCDTHLSGFPLSPCTSK